MLWFRYGRVRIENPHFKNARIIESIKHKIRGIRDKDQETLEVEDDLRGTTMMIGSRLRLAGP